jgi:hypothetical protein
MKKLIFSVVAGLVLCTAGFTGYKVYENQFAKGRAILIVNDIEALTQSEDYPIVIPGVTVTCDGGGSGQCWITDYRWDIMGQCEAFCKFTGIQSHHCSGLRVAFTNFCLMFLDNDPY